MKTKSFLKTTQIIFVSFGMAFSPALFGDMVIAEDFEDFDLGVQDANAAGTFTIMDGVGTTGSGKAAQIDSNSMQHRFNYNDGKSVTTFSFDAFVPSTASGNFLFAINHSGGGLAHGASNITRIQLTNSVITFQPAGAGGANVTYADNTVPNDTSFSVHLVLNNNTTDATNEFGVTVDGYTTQVWTEINGEFTYGGVWNATTAGKTGLTSHSFGIATSSGSNPAGFVVDNIRRAEGIAVIPEPSTYALFGGLGVLGFAFIIRRRRSRK